MVQSVQAVQKVQNVTVASEIVPRQIAAEA
jgi:hypothetical protein